MVMVSPLRLSACAQGILEEVNLLQEITEAARACVRAFVEDRTDASGLVSTDSFATFARGMGLQAQPWEAALKVPRASACVSENWLLSVPLVLDSPQGAHICITCQSC